MTNPIDELEKKVSALGPDAYEIYLTRSRRFAVEVKESQIDSLKEAVERGMALRLFSKGRVSFASTSAFDSGFLERMAQLSYNSLTLSEEVGVIELPAAPPSSGSRGPREEAFFDPTVAGRTAEEKTEAARTLEGAARRFDRRIRRVRGCRYEEERLEVTIKNSRGLNASFEKTISEISLMVVAEEKNEQQAAWDEQSSTTFGRLDPEGLGRRVAEKAVSLLGARSIPTGKFPAVLDPVVGSSLLGVLSSSFLGDQVQKRRSALRERLGEVVYARGCSIVDDGSLPEGIASAPFDGEGVATGRRLLVREGRIEGFLYDLRSAGLEGKGSTGHGIRPHYKEPPRVGTTNLFFEKGEGTQGDLFREMGTGFWIRDLIGVHTADPVSGDFSLGATGVWIEGGRPVHPVRGVAVSGNLHELMKKIVRVGDDLRFYHSYGSPSLLISEIDVGGASPGPA